MAEEFQGLWGGRFTKETDTLVRKFNDSLSFDKRLFFADIEGSLAHSSMLSKQGIISEEDGKKIREGLLSIKDDVTSGKLKIEGDYEDIHSFVEAKLTERVGDAGKRLHTGRSRNDQVALDMRLFARSSVVEIRGLKGSSPAIERHKGFEEALSKYPGIQLVASLQGDWTEKSGKKAMEQLLREGDVGKIDFVFGQNDRMAVGAYKAMNEAKLQGTLFCGIDALPTPGGGMECVRDGILDASYIYPTHGDEVMHLAMNILEGKPYEKDNPLKAALVTKANVHVLLMQNEEIERQDGYLSELKQKSDNYLVELSSQRLLTFLSIGFIGLLLLSAVITYLYNRQRMRINREREQMSRAQLDFYTQVSHELRTPLTLIEGPLAQLSTTSEILSW